MLYLKSLPIAINGYYSIRTITTSCAVFVKLLTNKSRTGWSANLFSDRNNCLWTSFHAYLSDYYTYKFQIVFSDFSGCQHVKGCKMMPGGFRWSQRVSEHIRGCQNMYGSVTWWQGESDGDWKCPPIKPPEFFVLKLYDFKDIGIIAWI